jgi:CHAT domain-containing protein
MPQVAAEVYGNRSLALSAAQRHDEALAAVQQAWPLVSGTPLLLRQLRLIAIEVAEAAARYDDAAALLGEMLAEPRLDLATRAAALNSRASIRVKQGHPQQAISDLEESLELRRRVGDQRGIAVGLSNLVRAHIEAGSAADAARFADESDRLWDELAVNAPDEPGQAGLAERIRPVISQARQELYLARGDVTAALAAAEAGRQGSLITLLRAAHADAAVPAEPPGADRIRALAQRLNATLVLYSALAQPETLQPGPTWATNMRAIHVWAVTAEGRICHAEPSAADFLALSREVRAAQQHAEEPAVDPEAVSGKLSRLLLHPIADALPTASNGRVIFAPATFMWELPFAALTLPDGEPLITRCPVSYAPSLHALEYLAAVRPDGAWRPASALVAGAPDNAQAIQLDGSYQDAEVLPAARDAVLDLARMYGQVPLIGADCTVPAVLALLPDADLVHIESHADLDSHPRFDRPAGTVLLNPSGADHGQLTSDLIGQTPMKARLVVLAACSTGLGLPANEGVRGLVRAFFSAGAGGVVASMWPVVDRPAAKIMTWFHEALWEGGDPARALQAATLRARERWSDPAIWAAFTLYGI